MYKVSAVSIVGPPGAPPIIGNPHKLEEFELWGDAAIYAATLRNRLFREGYDLSGYSKTSTKQEWMLINRLNHQRLIKVVIEDAG